ncbi:MAG: hypothetical protein MK538_12500 [Planctomycetes bacterium]|nr:hypothetical protein [Planctomycetota bacterium]
MKQSTPSRREFVKTLALGTAAGSYSFLANAPVAATPLRASSGGGGRRKKIALIATEVRRYSHAQHFIDRFLEGYGWHGRHHYPQMDLVSLYVDQIHDGDLARDREKRHHVKIYPSIREALTLGGSRLAVDGVVIIGEHGSYPRNAKGQTLYPRYRWFKEAVHTFEDSGRSVPVFMDKHLSTDWDECLEQVEDSRRLGFPYIAGSSLPVTWRFPALEIPVGTPMEESVCVCYGTVDSYDIHGLETAQCMSERRAGGESGVKSVLALRDEKMWAYIDAHPTTRRLVEAALCRSHTIRPREGYVYGVPTIEWAREAAPSPVGYFIEHRDGFRTCMLLLHGLLSDFNYAGKLAGSDEVVSCQMYLPMPPRHTTLADFFNPLVNNIEQTLHTGETPYPIERTLLTSGMTLFGVESLYRGEVELRTPELDVAYQAPQTSSFWRA